MALTVAVDGTALGFVVPKRHAKRAVTRNLIKRHMRAVAESNASRLARGAWVLRLRAGFDAATYAAARSDALAEAVRGELLVLLERAVLKVGR